jgi:hypothetical protein
MFKHMFILSLLIITTNHALTTIQASSLSCSTPTVLTDSTIIELDVPLILNSTCSPIIAGGGFGATDTVTFRPTVANSITLASNVIVSPIGIITVNDPCIWDVTSFNQNGQKFIFESVIINLNAGATIWADGVTFELQGTSQMITTPITP